MAIIKCKMCCGDIDPECAEAYLGKLMADLHINKQSNLKDCVQDFENNNNYQKVIRFADDELRNELIEYSQIVKMRVKAAAQEGAYRKAVEQDVQRQQMITLGLHKDS